MKNLLVVVDMVNGFINEGALSDKAINKITPNIEKLIKAAIGKNMSIIAFKDAHSYNDEEFKTFPIHCLKGSSESELIPELKKYEKNMCVIEKNTTNGFNTDKFKKIITKYDFDNVFVVGCCTDICVLNFVESYLNYIKNNNKPTKVVVFKDCCYTFNNESHNALNFHNESISKMEDLGAEIKNVNTNNNIQEN